MRLPCACRAVEADIAVTDAGTEHPSRKAARFTVGYVRIPKPGPIIEEPLWLFALASGPAESF